MKFIPKPKISASSVKLVAKPNISAFIMKLILSVISFIFFVYLMLPDPAFPEPPPGVLQSTEPADTETSLRRAYFTNLTREEVLSWYEDQFRIDAFLTLPSYRLNYPPENAQVIIRDQTRSTFLEEIVHPFRESLFINGFEPKEEKDAIFIEGRPWRQKIIVRHVPSARGVRVLVFVLILMSSHFLYKAYSGTLKDAVKISSTKKNQGEL